MAQHIPIDQFDHAVVKRIARGVRNQQSFSGSLRWQEITDDDYKESPNDRVFVANRRVPQSLVLGGVATIEVHTKPRKTYGQEATSIYLVA